MNVVLTAPIPGISTPSFPFGGAILAGLRIPFPPDRSMILQPVFLERGRRITRRLSYAPAKP
jgi:hypothetical protein